MASIKQVMDGLKLIADAIGDEANSEDTFNHDSDQIFAGGNDGLTSNVDAKAMTHVGWHWDEEFECWALFL